MIKSAFVVAFVSSIVFASGCKELDTDAKIRQFVKTTYESNPLLRENMSSTLDINTNDQGIKKTQTIHAVREKENKRSYFIAGENNPKCSITKGERDFICSECTYTTNTLCRSYKGDESSTVIKGTNIDTHDFKLLESEEFTNVCHPVKGKDKYVRIESQKVAGNSEYDKIVSFYDMEKKVSVTTNYFADNVLRKVYRFFPKYYKQIKGEWVSTVSRVRTVAGSEKQYSFETLVYVKKDANDQYLLYLSPSEDPLISDRLNTLFNTNR